MIKKGHANSCTQKNKQSFTEMATECFRLSKCMKWLVSGSVVSVSRYDYSFDI